MKYEPDGLTPETAIDAATVTPEEAAAWAVNALNELVEVHEEFDRVARLPDAEQRLPAMAHRMRESVDYCQKNFDALAPKLMQFKERHCGCPKCRTKRDGVEVTK